MKLIGFAQALLINIALIAGLNDPQLKVSPAGFFKALLENNALTEVNNIEEIRGGGQDREVKVRYQQRGTEDEVTDRDDCESTVTPEWKETTIGKPLYSKIGIFISDEQMRKYELEATQTLQAGTPSAPLMRALYETILTHCNGLIQKIDRNLVSAQSSKWGMNAAYGTKDAQTVVLNEKASMTDGFVKVITDAQANEVNDQLIVVGNGLVNAFDVFNRYKTGVDGQGFGSLAFNTYNDPKTATTWGPNHFGVFAKGNVGFVDINKNVGSYAGERGGSLFFTIPVPVTLANGELSSLVFDAQLKYKDCPIYNESGNKVADRGWLLILSKTYGLFNLPDDAFKEGDPLHGVNGSFHYIATAEKEA